MQAGRHGGRREREEAGVGPDVEELVRLAPEPRHDVQGKPVVRLRTSPVTPEELLRILAPRRVQHHEGGAVGAAGHLFESSGSR